MQFIYNKLTPVLFLTLSLRYNKLEDLNWFLVFDRKIHLEVWSKIQWSY